MKKYILAIDQGTTGTTALLIEEVGLKLVDKYNIEFKQYFPKPGSVEHDLTEIWETVKISTQKVLENRKIETSQISAIGITNQRETTCAYDKKGNPLAKAIVWQDRRTGDFCQQKQAAYQKLQQKTGLPLDPYFSATKMNWFLENVNEVSHAAKENNLCFSTIDSYLLFKMTGNQSFFTEPSNASRTLLMNLENCDWDPELLDFFGIKRDFLPEIKESFNLFGHTKGLDFLPDGIPISCILGDQQAALFGQAGYKKGDLKCTYGTGAFILLNTGNEKTYSSNGLLTTVAYKHQGKICYALEGSCYIAGAAVQWMRDNLEVVETSSEIEQLAKEVKDLDQMEHLLFMPFFTGIGSPYWQADAKAAILGITRDTAKKHLARACLDGMALAINDSICALVKDSPEAVNEIRVDGGACQNDLLMQIQANFSHKKIIRPKVIETTAYGVAIGSQIGLGKIEFKDIDHLWQEDKSFNEKGSEYYKNKQNQWDKYIKKVYLD